MSCIVNFVMSQSWESVIFNDIIGYFQRYTSPDIEIIPTEKPLENAHVYHYFRPHLEKSLKPKTSITTVHHDLLDTDYSLDPDQFLPHYRQAQTVICLNQTQKQLLSNNWSINHTTVIPHGYNHDLFPHPTKKQYQSNKKIRLGFFSKRYDRRVKGEAYLYELLLRLNPELFSFTLVGHDRIHDAQLMRNLGFEVSVFSRLPYSLFPSLYRNIDLLLILSVFEGGPACVPESLASGTPIISTNMGMSSDLIKSTENGAFLSGNIDQDTEMLHNLATNHNNSLTRLFDITGNSTKQPPNLITWQEVVEKHLPIYKSLA